MEIYLDANATTPVLAQARAAAMEAMSDDFGNPSSVHSTGLKARALMDGARARARQVLGAPSGRLLFLSGATEGIQTSVLSALSGLRARRSAGGDMPDLLLYGATEHRAVPEALKHWNALLELGLRIVAIPVGRDGRHDLEWLRAHATRAGLVCTMAANNETGVISDLDGIAQALVGSSAPWMVDGVQALGKLALQLVERRIDYAPFSGHKLYAPKGIGLLYVREGAPFTPLMAGGGQESAQRSGTENMSGIAALGAVLAALGDGHTFKDHATLAAYRGQLAQALESAFPGVVFNAPPSLCLPTTLNFSVPGLSSKLLLDLFDAADMRISAGSACSAAKAQPSYVLEAMGLPAWQAASAVRLSFGPAVDAGFIQEACARIRACGESLRESCFVPALGKALPAQGVTRFVVDGACCYLLADAASRRCVVIDPLPELDERLAQLLRCQGYALAAVLDTHSHGDHASSAARLRAALPELLAASDGIDALGWPDATTVVALGALRLSRLAIPGHTEDSTAYLLHDARGIRLAFVGDTVMPGALGRSDFEQSAPLAFGASLRRLELAVGARTLLLPAHDYDDRFASTLETERKVQPLLGQVLAGDLDDAGFAVAKADLERHLGMTEYQTMACGARVDRCAGAAPQELAPAALSALLEARSSLLVVDVREPYEQRMSQEPELGIPASGRQAVPLSRLLDALPDWLALPADRPVLFFCRSGNRSAQAANALRRLGHAQAWSLAGGLALWPKAAKPVLAAASVG
jgi:cysteine desulfurase